MVALLAGMSAPGAVAATNGPGPRVIATLSPRSPVLLGTDEVVDVEVQNVGEQATSRPTAIRFTDGSFSGDDDSFSGEGEDWTCSGRLCTLAIDLPAGAVAPPLVIRRPTASLAAGPGLYARTVRAAVIGEQGEEDDRTTSTTTPAVTGLTADLATAVEGAGPTTQRGRRAYTVRVRNLGSARTPHGVHVVLRHGAEPGGLISAVGDGWRCDPAVGSCDRPAPLDAGALAPAIEVVAPPSALASWSYELEAVASGGGPNDEPYNDRASAWVSAAAAMGPQLVPTAEDAPSTLPSDGRGRFLVRVRNVGVGTSDGRVTVRLGRTPGSVDSEIDASGDGWTCPEREGTCTTDRVVVPGAELPPLTASVPGDPLGLALRQTMHVTLSGGDDAEVRDNTATTTRVTDIADREGEVVVAIRNIKAGATNHPASADLVVRNPTDSTRTRPTTVRVNVPGPRGELSGAGWVCTSTPICTTTRAVSAGGSLPSLHITWTPDTASPDEVYSNRGPLRAGPTSSEPFAGYGVASAEVPAGRRGADPVVTVLGPPPLRGGEIEETRNVVENVGTESTRGPIAVELDAVFDGAKASGDGWVCRRQSCSRDDALAPGESFPAIVTRRRLAVTGDDHDRTSRAILTAPDPADDVDIRNGDVSADAGEAGALPDLVPTIEVPRAEIGERRASAEVVVRNAGPVDSSGAVLVSSQAAGLGGDGWTCAEDVCRHQGPVPAGGRLPPLQVERDLPHGPGPRSHLRGIGVVLSNRSDGTDENNEASVVVPAAGDTPQRPLSLLAGRDVAADPSGRALLDALLRGRSAVPGRGPLRIRAASGPGVTLDSVDVAGDDDACDPTGCVVNRELARLEELPITVGVRLAPGVERGVVHLVARAADDGADPAETDLVVTRPSSVPDPRLLLQAPEPAGPTSDAVVVATVRNGGTASAEPVTVVMGLNTDLLRSAGGSGWTCTREYGLRCRSVRTLPAGGSLPPVVLRMARGTYGGPTSVSGRIVVGRDTYADSASVSVPSADVFGPGLLTSIDPVSIDSPDDARGFDLRVRNADDRPTTKPIEVDVGANGLDDSLLSLTGPGWRCSRDACRHDAPLGPGETAAPIEYRTSSPPPRSIGTYERYTADAGPGANAEVVFPHIPADTTDLATSIVSRPATVDAPAALVIVAGNLGSGPTAGPVEVELDRFDPSRPVRASGPGWTCPDGDDVCRYDGLLPGDSVAAPLTVVGVGEAQQFTVYVRDSGRDGPGRFTSRVYPTAPDPVAAATSSDLTLDLGPLSPVRPGAPVDARLTVRNAGTESHSGEIRVRYADADANYEVRRSDRTASGDGWTCDDDGLVGTCTRPGPLAAGSELPPILVSFSAPTEPESLVEFSANVEDDTPANDGVTGLITIGASNRLLQVTVRGSSVGRAGELQRFSAEVRNAGTATVDDDAVVRFSKRPAGAVATGDGWSCDSNLVCRHAGPLAPGRLLPRIELVAPTPATAGSVVAARVTAGSDDPTGVPDSSVTASRAPRFVDLLPVLALEHAPTVGEDDVAVLRIRNTGDRDATGTTSVRLDAGVRYRAPSSTPLPAGTTASGDGWKCSAVSCRTDDVAPSGGVLPDLRVVVPRETSDAVTVRASIGSTADQAVGNDEASISADATGPTTSPEQDASDVISIGTAPARARTGERIQVQVPIAGRRPLDDTSARVVVVLPTGLRYDGPGAGSPTPNVDGRTLTWSVRTPRDEDDRLLTFWAVVADDAAAGSARLTGALAVEGAATERSETILPIVEPVADGVSVSSVPDDRSTRIAVLGDLLRSTDRFELVGNGRTIEGREAEGDDRRVVATFDACGSRAGSYDLVVRATTGVVRRLDRAIEVRARRTAGSPACPGDAAPGGGSGGSSGGSSPSSGGSPPTGPGTWTGQGTGPVAAGPTGGDGLAALLAALAPPPPAATSPAPNGARPTVRFSGTPRAPRTRAFAGSGWLVTVHTTGAQLLSAELVTDASTARRLRVRVGAVLARGTALARSAGPVRVRLTVPSSLGGKVRRAARITGTLRVRATSVDGVATASRRVTVLR